MTLFLFEARRLSRKPAFVAVFTVFLAIGIEQAVMDRTEPPWFLLFLPLFVVWVAAFDLSGDLRRGRLDLILSRGTRLSRLLLVRLLLALLVGAATTGLLSAPALLTRTIPWRETGESLARLVYWGALSVLLGLVASSEAVMLLATLTSALVVWWGADGCLELTGKLPTESPWRFFTFFSHVLGSFLPLPLPHGSDQAPPTFLEFVRLPVAILWLSVACLWADRRNIHVREEG